MDESSSPKLVAAKACSARGSKSEAMRSGSTLAIRRSLMSRALPVAICAAGAVALPGMALLANSDGVSSSHVRVSLIEAQASAPRTLSGSRQNLQRKAAALGPIAQSGAQDQFVAFIGLEAFSGPSGRAQQFIGRAYDARESLAMPSDSLVLRHAKDALIFMAYAAEAPTDWLAENLGKVSVPHLSPSLAEMDASGISLVWRGSSLSADLAASALEVPRFAALSDRLSSAVSQAWADLPSLIGKSGAAVSAIGEQPPADLLPGMVAALLIDPKDHVPALAPAEGGKHPQAPVPDDTVFAFALRPNEFELEQAGFVSHQQGTVAGGMPAETADKGLWNGSAIHTAKLVRIGAVLDVFSDQFEPEELARLRSSAAVDAYVAFDAVRAAGIPVALGLDSDPMAILLMQDTSGAGTTGGSEAGSGEGIGNLGLRRSLAATVSTGFDSNPFLAAGDNTSAASVRVQLAPTLSRQGERGSFRLSGRVEHIEYLGRYDSLQNYGADLAGSRRLNERLEINGGLSFQSNILATNFANPFDNGGLDPANPLPPTGNDVTILGEGQRRTQYGANAGLAYTLSERDQLVWSATARADRFGSAGLADSNFLAQQFQYSRQLNEDLSVGALIDASLIDFDDATQGDAQTLSPQVQITANLAPRLKLSGSVGVAITRFDLAGVTDTTTALSGNLSLCHTGDRSNLCINGSRQVLPAAIGGALLQTTAGATYSYRLSERDTLQLSGSYGTASQPSTVTVADFESINASARYERRVNERLRFFASGGVLDVAGNAQGSATNIQGLIGITFDLGQSR